MMFLLSTVEVAWMLLRSSGTTVLFESIYLIFNIDLDFVIYDDICTTNTCLSYPFVRKWLGL